MDLAKSFESFDVDVNLPFVVGGAAAIEIIVAHDRFKSRGGPELKRFGGLNVIVAVEQNGGLARSVQGFAVDERVHFRRRDLDIFQSRGAKPFGNPARGPLDVRFVLALGADAGDAQKLLQLLKMRFAQRFDVSDKIHNPPSCLVLRGRSYGNSTGLSNIFELCFWTRDEEALLTAAVHDCTIIMYDSRDPTDEPTPQFPGIHAHPCEGQGKRKLRTKIPGEQPVDRGQRARRPTLLAGRPGSGRGDRSGEPRDRRRAGMPRGLSWGHLGQRNADGCRVSVAQPALLGRRVCAARLGFSAAFALAPAELRFRLARPNLLVFRNLPSPISAGVSCGFPLTKSL